MSTRTSSSAFGDYHGPVGTVVLRRWKSIEVMQGRPGPREKKGTLSQQQQNNIFGMVSSFFPSAKRLINLGFQEPKAAKMSPYNAAVSYHILNAVFGDPGDPHLNLSKVRLSYPIRHTEPAWNAVLLTEPGFKVTVRWEQNPFPMKCTKLDDRVVIAYYDSHRKKFIRERDALRSDGNVTLTHTEWSAAGELYYYMFMLSQDGKLVSETEYLGMVSFTEGI